MGRSSEEQNIGMIVGGAACFGAILLALLLVAIAPNERTGDASTGEQTEDAATLAARDLQLH